MKLSEILQDKANKTSALIAKAIRVSSDLEPKNVSIEFNAIPCRVDDSGRFMILTGTKDLPHGIGVKNPPELILLYNDKGGIFVETSLVIEIIKAHRSELKPTIDETYSIMGVTLSIGLISSWTGEDFLTALHLSSLHD